MKKAKERVREFRTKLPKVKNRSIRTIREIRSKLTVKTPE